MIVTNLLTQINFSGLTGTLPTTWNLTPTYPNGALDVSHITARSRVGTGAWTGWVAVTAFNDTNVATFTAPAGSTQVEFRRSTPRYAVYLDPKAVSSRVSSRNLQINADQGLYTAIEWAAQFGIDAQATLLPSPGEVPNTLGLQQQTQNYWTKADYSPHVWNFSFAGGYLDRSHVRAQVLLSTGWVALDIDPNDREPQYNYELREDGSFCLTEDGVIESREGTIDPNDPNNSPFRFIGPFEIYMDFSGLPEVPQALIIYRHTPRNVKVSSLYDAARITADGMSPSAQHALFVAVELGEQLSQYAPPCDCFTAELETLGWSYPIQSPISPTSQSITLGGNASILYNVEIKLTGAMETRPYGNITGRVGGGGRFVTATDAESNPPGEGNNIYLITIDHPLQHYYVNSFLPGETASTYYHPDGSDSAKLSFQVAGNATITFSADPVDGAGGFGPQFGTITARITSHT